MSNFTAQELIEHFQLSPHPEGGHYQVSYRSKELLPRSGLPARFSGDRLVSTAIYFLLQKGERSRMHRIRSDEVWHFYLGGPLVVVEVGQSGEVKKTVIGSNLKSGERLQYAVPAGVWFGAYPAQGTEFALVGCTVAPGFDFADFELASPSDFSKIDPKQLSSLKFLMI